MKPTTDTPRTNAVEVKTEPTNCLDVKKPANMNDNTDTPTPHSNWLKQELPEGYEGTRRFDDATTDTPRTDACPYCGADRTSRFWNVFMCGTAISKVESKAANITDLCREREARQKAEARVDHYAELINKADDKVIKLEAEVERLRAVRRKASIVRKYVKYVRERTYKAEVERLRQALSFIANDDASHDSTEYYRGVAYKTLNPDNK